MDPLEWAGAFVQERQDEQDGQWAARVAFALRTGGVADASVDAAMQHWLDAVRATGAAPQDALGPADEVAAAELERLSLGGGDFVERGFDHRTAAVAAAGFAALLAAVLGVLQCREARQVQWRLGDPLLVVLIAMGVWVTGAVYHLATRRMQSWCALLAGLAAGLPLLAGGALATRLPVDLGEHSTLWWFVLAAALALLAVVLRRVVPAQRVTTVPPGADQAWLDAARAELRRRDDLSAAQVAEQLAQAREFSVHAGGSLGEEFGNPVGFARSLPPRPGVAMRRAAWWFTAITVVDLGLVLHRWDPWTGLVLACSVFCCGIFWALSVLEVRRATRRG